ncbi:major facilitator superfamily protein [Oxobacter pfennigii]|uniref:Major facilitator superfamily protein n=1 Tax=Oxobacter pfennigii TaxID=36849 RepID=A0A0P8YEK8_9CLOT|nr:MFS transporter [Oxobacter pfennigii]KPU45647.1 major facilitator superfamily protein [Oxobacter pfennigii]
MDIRKKNIHLLYAIAFLQGMVFYGPIATLYRRAQGLSVFDITLIESISLFFIIAFEVPWGYIADKIGYKKTIVICNTLYFISKIVFWKADSFLSFLSERLILSLVISGLSGCDSAFLYLCAGEKESQRTFGIYEAMTTAGLIFASTIFSAVIKSDYKMSALLTVISYATAMIFSLFLADVKPQTSGTVQLNINIKFIISSFIQNKSFIMLLLAASLLAESNQTITVFLSQLQYVRSGISPSFMGYIHILVTLSGLVSAFSFRLTGLIGEVLTSKILFCTSGIACILMALFPSPVISVFSVIVLRLTSSMFVPIRMDIQNRQINISGRATMLSVYSIIMNMTAVVTNLIFGKITDIGVEYAMAAGGVFCLAGLGIYSTWQSHQSIKHYSSL